MTEKEMGYRGSKSVISNDIAVKEQRVDGGLHGISKSCIRISTAEKLAKHCEENNITPLEASQKTISVVKKLGRQIESQASKELANITITPEEQESVRNVLNETRILRENAGSLILEAVEALAGSGNPLGVSGNYERIPMAPYFLFKDLITIFAFIFVLSLFVFFMPNVLGDSENYVVANPMQTPAAIVPE
nr:cytochrome b, mitochondrial [Tanacetum cinerariifolium]